MLNVLVTIEPVKKLDWKSHVDPSVNAYHHTKDDITGYAPYFLMLGRHVFQ